MQGKVVVPFVDTRRGKNTIVSIDLLIYWNNFIAYQNLIIMRVDNLRFFNGNFFISIQKNTM